MDKQMNLAQNSCIQTQASFKWVQRKPTDGFDLLSAKSQLNKFTPASLYNLLELIATRRWKSSQVLAVSADWWGHTQTSFVSLSKLTKHGRFMVKFKNFACICIYRRHPKTSDEEYSLLAQEPDESASCFMYSGRYDRLPSGTLLASLALV